MLCPDVAAPGTPLALASTALGVAGLVAAALATVVDAGLRPPPKTRSKRPATTPMAATITGRPSAAWRCSIASASPGTPASRTLATVSGAPADGASDDNTTAPAPVVSDT